MKNHKFKERCDWCNSMSSDYETKDGKIICVDCMRKNGGRIELEVPIQMELRDYMMEVTK